MIPALLMAALLSAGPIVAGSPKPPPRVALQATEGGQVRLVGPNFTGLADQVLTLDDGRGWELVGTEQRPAKFALWTGQSNALECVSGGRILYSPARNVLHVVGTTPGSSTKLILNKGASDEKR